MFIFSGIRGVLWASDWNLECRPLPSQTSILNWGVKKVLELWSGILSFSPALYSRQILGLVSYHETGWKNPCCGCAGSEGLCHYWHLFCLCLFVWLLKQYITKLTPWNLTYINTRNSIWKENGLELYLIQIIHHFWYLCQNFGGVNRSLQSFFGAEMQWKTVVEEGKKMEVHWKLYSAGLLFWLLQSW